MLTRIVYYIIKRHSLTSMAWWNALLSQRKIRVLAGATTGILRIPGPTTITTIINCNYILKNIVRWYMSVLRWNAKDSIRWLDILWAHRLY